MVVFADADASMEEADYVIIGVPHETSTTFVRGTRLAPLYIRLASYNFEEREMETSADLSALKIHDSGDHALEGLGAIIDNSIGQNKVPVVIGGEHSISPSVAEYLPEGTGILVLDAHLDFRDDYMGDENNHACASRRMSEHVGIDNIMVAGLRSVSIDEMNDDIPNIALGSDITRGGVEVLGPIRNWCERFERLYVSIDLDVLDPSVAPGVGNPEPDGLMIRQVRDILRPHLGRIVGFDVVELSPPADNGAGAATAAWLIRWLIAGIDSSL